MTAGERPARAAVGHIDAIGGLRALAVLSVVLFHLDAAWLPGGFVGVDVFFVISGFVVAHSVIGARATSFRDYFLWFYRRRFLRILPAIFVYVLVIGILGVLFIPTAEVSRFIEITGAASLFGASNFVLLWKSGDYFAAATEFNTFTHTWSLAVEEQYYLIFPLFSYFLLICAPGPRRGLAVALMWAACIASLACAAVLTVRAPAAAFYMLPARFWELGLGFLLRYHDGAARRAGATLARHRAVESVVAGAALLALGYAFVATSPRAFPFPGAVLPCAATAVLLLLAWQRGDGWAARLLSWRLLTAIGLISYSLYLWHWGVIVLMRWTVGLDAIALRAIAGAAMLLLAILSYRLVERPLRYSGLLNRLPPLRFFAAYGVAGALIGAVVLGAMVAKPRVGLAASNDAAVWSPYVARPGAPGCAVRQDASTMAGGTRVTLTPACPAATDARLFIVGDSHAGAYIRLAATIAAQDRRPVTIMTKGGCKLLPILPDDVTPSCTAFDAAAVDALQQAMRPGDTLLVSAYYTPRERDIWGDVPAPARRDPAIEAQLRADAIARLRRWRAAGLAVVLEGPKPTMPTAAFRCADWFNRTSAYCAHGDRVDRTTVLHRSAFAHAALAQIAAAVPGVRLWDPIPGLCAGPVCPAYLNGKPLYFDTDHLSGAGNERLVPLLRRELAAAPAHTPVNDTRPALPAVTRPQE
ncbi:acyltransferase [Sphingomonas ginsenosidimutans]|jgi:peptidoglycan/LPS O-acetylase OafA/YrhL|uniref:Acyltransferase n=1 Tax=Sphingomonas ginsenosidimutans TaxID=862134 RepID=A0A2A4HZY5_9SPHN|nr:acyltransferase family protein [Sphingomonas ginsenosidimutans]PCG10096.1 acyltransferase [Sphingomonas ginsenosidimutans]